MGSKLLMKYWFLCCKNALACDWCLSYFARRTMELGTMRRIVTLLLVGISALAPAVAFAQQAGAVVDNSGLPVTQQQQQQNAGLAAYGQDQSGGDTTTVVIVGGVVLTGAAAIAYLASKNKNETTTTPASP